MNLTAIRRAWLLAGGIACGLAASWGTATASPYSEVASGFDEDDPFDLHVRIDYDVAVRRAAIKREVVGLPGTLPGDPMPIAKDLVFRGIRHTVTPRFELGVFTDLAVTAALPIVVSDRRTLSFDQRATPCVFPGGGDAPTCINADNSTTVRDGLLPATGFDARDPSGPGFTNPDDATIFRGPGRSGLDQLHLGLVWAPMNQERDPTKPTWKIGTEMRLAVGRTMKLDRRDPSRETGVGRGLHELRAWTSMARRTSWAEPYVEMWWMATVGERSDSQFIRPGFGQTRVAPQQRAGTIFGFEAIAWENPAEGQRISLDFGARLEAHFEGRAYTEMWEVFQYAGDATAGGPLVLDSDPVQPGLQALSHPGVTNVENYLTFAGRVGFDAVLGEKVRFGAFFELLRDQGHLITFTDAGKCADTGPSSCVVTPGTDEVNPLHVPLIDTVGHRYRVDEVMEYIILVDARVLF